MGGGLVGGGGGCRDTHEGADDAAFGVVALPALLAVPAEAHGLDAALAAAFALVHPDGLPAASRGRGLAAASAGAGPAPRAVALDADAVDGALEGLHERHVPEVVLLALGDLQRFLQLADALLQVVVVDQVAVLVLEACFAGPQRDALPVLLLRVVAAAVAGGQRPHVVLFEEGFALVPCAAPGGVEEVLGEELDEQVVLALVFFEAR